MATQVAMCAVAMCATARRTLAKGEAKRRMKGVQEETKIRTECGILGGGCLGRRLRSVAGLDQGGRDPLKRVPVRRCV